MKRFEFFCKPSICTGCLLCEMACSLKKVGTCTQAGSVIRVSTHPQFGTSIPLIVNPFECDKCGACVQVCTPGALQMIPEEKWPEFLLNKEYVPVPTLPHLKAKEE